MLRLNPHHVFRHEGELHLIDVERLTAHRLDDPAVARALAALAADPRTPVADRTLRKFAALGLIPAPETPRAARLPEPAVIRNIALFVTQRCNLRCVYCYGDGGTYGAEGVMTLATARRAVDWHLERSGALARLGILFFGGEPLLNVPLIREVVDYARERGAARGKAYGFQVTTNGTLLDDETIAFFKEYRIRARVSFDGPREVQDAQRPFANGAGSYDAIRPRLRALLDALPDTPCRATLVGRNDPAAIDDALREIGFAHRRVTPASPCLCDQGGDRPGDEPDLAHRLERAESDARALLAAIQRRDTEVLRRLRGAGVPLDLVERFINQEKRHVNCGAGKGMVAIGCSGDVYLCQRFVGEADQKLGSIFSGGLDRERYLRDSVRDREACATCLAKYLCGGGCYYQNLGASGDVFVPPEDRCALMRRWAELTAAICLCLDADDRAYLVAAEIIEDRPCPIDLF